MELVSSIPRELAVDPILNAVLLMAQVRGAPLPLPFDTRTHTHKHTHTYVVQEEQEEQRMTAMELMGYYSPSLTRKTAQVTDAGMGSRQSPDAMTRINIRV